MQSELKELQELMRGKGADGGFIHATLRLAELMHGTKENPGGLVRRIEEVSEDLDKRVADVNATMTTRLNKLNDAVDSIKKVIWTGAGVMMAVNLGWMVFAHFHKN